MRQYKYKKEATPRQKLLWYTNTEQVLGVCYELVILGVCCGLALTCITLRYLWKWCILAGSFNF
jgi:predicted PurR-regulated permease PerM